MPHLGLVVCDKCLTPYALLVTNAAKASTVDHQTLSNQIDGYYGISPETVLQLEKTFDVRTQTRMKDELAGDITRAHEIAITPFGEAVRQ
ncbi:addiction module antidote protein, HigA family [Asaia lannensis]|uniref:Addiction module antidote protein, HigA family n=1 Tax=Asaia lannensis NBRC 102526 TaxID=1307926 RepID=A0ABT1CGR6_9PROT|nr:addiction module antidote protein, HigA family [Asaia lannensis]MCO6160053.1 addiction module antidote protein, HigA family [Asaia lannensis NBRC 102526]GBQ99416.1 hypothetical protein AA102526_1803 [Asaia lannensis NBRC 102526]